MGFNVSFHPVDVELIQERLLPFVQGKGDIDDLVEKAVHIAQVRARARAWGVGLSQQRESAESKKPLKKGKTLAPERFESDLHVWGRPFFITVDRPDQVSRAIHRYLAAQLDEVDDIAREMLRFLDPKLVDRVEPPQESLYLDDQLAAGIRLEMDLFRDCFRARAKKSKVRNADNKFVSPKELFQKRFPTAILAFAAQFRPGWMARGHLTGLLQELGLEMPPYVETAAALFKPLMLEVPEIADNLENSISAASLVGGYVQPDNVSDFRIFLDEHLEKAKTAKCQLDFQKVQEAVQDAEREHMAFAEAAEIYSAPLGITN